MDIENNQVTFKENRNNHHVIDFKLRKNSSQYRQLLLLQEKSTNKEMPFSVQLNDKYLYITFDEGKLGNLHENRHIIKDRYLGIDLNPNYIGLSIIDFPSNKVIHKQCFELKELTKKLKVSSSNPKQLYQNNKLKHETIHIAKEITKMCIHFGVEAAQIPTLPITISISL